MLRNDVTIQDTDKPRTVPHRSAPHRSAPHRKSIVMTILVLMITLGIFPTLTSCFDPPISPPVGMFVKVTIDCTAPVQAGIPAVLAITQTGILFDDTLLMPDGYSVLNALQMTGLPFTQSLGPYIYVNSICGIPEGITSAYPTSGWLFYVNGEMPMEPANTLQLCDGDEVRWVYSLTYDF